MRLVIFLLGTAFLLVFGCVFLPLDWAVGLITVFAVLILLLRVENAPHDPST
jgi:hypothetical protein